MQELDPEGAVDRRGDGIPFHDAVPSGNHGLRSGQEFISRFCPGDELHKYPAGMDTESP